MKLSMMGVALVAGLVAQAAEAADMGQATVTRTTRVAPVASVVPERAISRLVNQGIGYSVLHESIGVANRGYRVHVTCTLTETFAQTYCPTPAYESYCPNATIVCR